MMALLKSAFNIVAAVVVLFALIAVVVAKNTSALMVSEAERTVKSVVKNTTGQIDRLMTSVESAVANQKWVIGEHLDDPDYMYRITQELVENNVYIVGSTVAFRPGFFKSKGRLYSPYSCRSGNGRIESFALPYEYPEHEWYKLASESGEARWSEPYFDEGGAQVDMSTFSMPVYDSRTNFLAIFTADISLEQLKKHVASICPFPNSYAVMRSAQGKVLVDPPAGRRAAEGKTITIHDTADNGWTVEVVCPVEEILRGAQQLVVRIVIFSVLGLVMIFFVVWIYSSRLQRSAALRARMAGELNTARSIQSGVLPKDFSDGVYALLRPAREVGGDLYDFVRKDGRLCFIIGDASGKGVPAALFAFMTSTVFRMACGMGLGAVEIAERINQTLAHNNEMSMFVTAFLGVLDFATGELEFVCAGHNAPVVIQPDGTAHFLPLQRDPPAGAVEGWHYRLQKTRIEPGSRILAYTDGVTEATRGDYVLFGDDRLLAYAATCGGCGVRDIADGLLGRVGGFVFGEEQSDDITIMAIGR